MSPASASSLHRIWAVIPAAGIGQRAVAHSTAAATTQPPLPKQYHRLLGRSLLAHTLHAFAQVPTICHTVVVIAPDDTVFASQTEHAFARTQAWPVGGASRAASVRNGLAVLATHYQAQPEDWVLVHDAARCLITPEWIERLIQACQNDAIGGLLALPLPDTLKEEQPRSASSGLDEGGKPARVAQTVPRSGKWLAHTPQMFRLGLLQAALDGNNLPSITDEASAIELAGHAPQLVPSSAQNFKVTYPEDFALAEAVLRARNEVASPMKDVL
ncbi:2-C-methyl-D-erythritol 4-phosphate cytidylyltransferase [Lampropedia puyangensis]|uniref:2-C-methyl-D-erythritol 4-phosphate cytidylyltransferase n=1 Tax=Lampropedia puyangensis TaxID=1330072 RepID=A0A4S8F7Q6_9BURK|nr:2-C-methyl-D-erythritol 4-phosphate cytidylyltransferase [Lampropedia puyangensis]THU03648.1 2-C-methyl-D-erythritol 4-phosphate cytidylyltransferase [Lampropedia puyangensis]